MARTQLDLSDIVMSPEFSQTFQVERHSGGKTIQGRFVEEAKTFSVVGVVSATDEKDIAMIPEGDRASESKTFHTISPLFTSKGGGRQQGNADILKYNGQSWKVVATINSGDYGYYKTIAISMRAD